MGEVAERMKHAVDLFFATAKFDSTGPVREDANAGNRFYGEDLARWLVDAMAARWKGAIDEEDWGWLVSKARGEGDPDRIEMIAVYLDEPAGGAKPAVWRLVLQQKVRRKFLGILSWTDVPVSADFQAAVEQAFAVIGAERRQDGQ